VAAELAVDVDGAAAVWIEQQPLDRKSVV